MLKGSPRHTLLAIGTLALASLGLTPDAQAIRIRHDVSVEAYNELARAEVFRAVGYVASGNMGCTGALVAPDLVLTAAHCMVDSNGTPIPARNVRFIIDHAGEPTQTFRAKHVDIHPEWDESRNKHTDLALITLEREIEGVTPLPVTDADPFGRLATMIGYGTKGTGHQDANTTHLPGAFRKIAAHNTVDRLRLECCNSGNWVIQLDFDDPGQRKRSRLGSKTPLALEGGASFGDSGSPLLVEYDGQQFVVGVASYITGQGVPGVTGYGEVAGYQWTGSGEVVSWLEMLGVTVWENPFEYTFLNSEPEDIEAPPAAPSNEPADMNADNSVTAQDAATLARGISNDDPDADLNGDGRVNALDAAVLLESLGYTHAVYPKKKQWKRAVRDFFRNSVEPQLVGLSKKERKLAEKVLKQAYKHVGA